MKRPFDIIGAVLGLMFILPLAPFIVLAIVADSPGPVLVRLPRVSRGKIIHVFKFRSMVRNAHSMKAALAHLNERSDGPLFKIQHDPRLTRVGRHLRKLHIDEFPQFWNVLVGDISLVGPRPHEPEELEKYPMEFRRIAQAKGGLTGLSQVSGASGLPFQKEAEYDLYYLDNQSTALDISILARSVKLFLVGPRGV
jgi:lipopolysaccharide/colanic/teichoic acid biosynthesis glycosyltransferase